MSDATTAGRGDCLEAIILVGGLGTRLRSVVSDVPKPLAPVQGKPFVVHLMNYWAGQGIRRFVLACAYLYDVVQAQLTQPGVVPPGVEIKFAVEPGRLGTGGGLLWASQSLADRSRRFLAMNGDSFIPVDLQRFQSEHFQNRADLSVALFRVPSKDRYSLVQTDSAGRILAFGGGEGGDDAACWINAGVYMIEPTLFVQAGRKPGDTFSWESDLLPDLLKLRAARVYAHKHPGDRFIDIGIPEDFVRAQAMDFTI